MHPAYNIICHKFTWEILCRIWIGTLADTRCALHNANAGKHFVTISYATVCSPALRNVPRSCLSQSSESNPSLLRNEEDQNGVINIAQLTPELGGTRFYVLGWNEILKFLSEYVSQPLKTSPIITDLSVFAIA